jgi:outer membrane protein assembly factor BamB
LIYVEGVSGDLACLEAATGQQRWQRSLTRDFRGSIPNWGYSESPLIDGDKVIATPGGREAALVALDKKSGATIWKARVPQGDRAAYASAITADVGGVRQYIQFLHGGVVAVAAQDGTFLWRYNQPANGTANCSTPIYHGGHVFAASSYGKGGGLARISSAGQSMHAEEVYFTRKMLNHHGGMVLLGGYLYGSNESSVTCLEFQTGKIMWEDRRPGKGSIFAADGCLYYRSERGPVVLFEANPQRYAELGRFQQPERSSNNAWPHPVIANGKLYLRDQDVLLCYDVKQS